MPSLGELITGGKAAPPKPVVSDEPRLHRVHLCQTIFTTLEVSAVTPEEAFALAQARAGEAVPDFTTAPHAFRADVRRPVDPRDAAQGFQWVRLERVTDAAGNLYWGQGKAGA